MVVLVKYRPFTIILDHGGNEYQGKITPITHSNKQGQLPSEFSVVLNGIFRGILTVEQQRWQSTSLDDELLVAEIGKQILSYYE